MATDLYEVQTEKRFWAKVQKTETCWLWTGAKTKGYGRFYARRLDCLAHRYAYERFVGPIPDGLTIDHLCRVPACVNPAHMEPVTSGESVRRGDNWQRHLTTCVRGHPFDGHAKRQRTCLTCHREACRLLYLKRKAAR